MIMEINLLERVFRFYEKQIDLFTQDGLQRTYRRIPAEQILKRKYGALMNFHPNIRFDSRTSSTSRCCLLRG
jgi:hypothetical protein